MFKETKHNGRKVPRFLQGREDHVRPERDQSHNKIVDPLCLSSGLFWNTGMSSPSVTKLISSCPKFNETI